MMALIRKPAFLLALRRPKRINRAPSPALAAGLPWASVALLSLVPFAPLIASAPVLPPVAFMALLAWRMLRPGLLPVWAGAPLGAFDDIYSGQPFGSAVLLWSASMLAMDLVDRRLRWRGFFGDWALAAAFVAACLVLAAVFADLAGGAAPLDAIVPQVLLSAVIHPVVMRLVAALDRVRLMPLRVTER